MTIKDLRVSAKMTQVQFALYLGIPFRTIQNWEGGQRTPPDYVLSLIEYRLRVENFID